MKLILLLASLSAVHTVIAGSIDDHSLVARQPQAQGHNRGGNRGGNSVKSGHRLVGNRGGNRGNKGGNNNGGSNAVTTSAATPPAASATPAAAPVTEQSVRAALAATLQKQIDLFNQNEAIIQQGTNGQFNNNNGGQGTGAVSQTSTTVDNSVIQIGAEQDGTGRPGAEGGQASVLTSKDNFINFCASQKAPLQNGLQFRGQASCNQIPMGMLPSSDKTPTTVFTNPANGANIKTGSVINFQVKITNMQLGSFSNAQSTYYAQPQILNAQGQIIGHTHITVSPINGNTLGDFIFFKGVNAPAFGDVLTATVAAGLPPNQYRVCSMTSSTSHQPILVNAAQRVGQDDCIRFTVSDNGDANAGVGDAASAKQTADFLAKAAADFAAKAGGTNADANQAASSTKAEATPAAAQGNANAGQNKNGQVKVAQASAASSAAAAGGEAKTSAATAAAASGTVDGDGQASATSSTPAASGNANGDGQASATQRPSSTAEGGNAKKNAGGQAATATATATAGDAKDTETADADQTKNAQNGGAANDDEGDDDTENGQEADDKNGRDQTAKDGAAAVVKDTAAAGDKQAQTGSGRAQRMMQRRMARHARRLGHAHADIH